MLLLIYLSTVEKLGPNPIIAKNKFKPLQKRTVKCILGEINKKYNDQEYYTRNYIN